MILSPRRSIPPRRRSRRNLESRAEVVLLLRGEVSVSTSTLFCSRFFFVVDFSLVFIPQRTGRCRSGGVRSEVICRLLLFAFTLSFPCCLMLSSFQRSFLTPQLSPSSGIKSLPLPLHSVRLHLSYRTLCWLRSYGATFTRHRMSSPCCPAECRVSQRRAKSSSIQSRPTLGWRRRWRD